MNIRFSKGKMPPRNFMLPVSKANPGPGQKWDPWMETWKRHDLDPDTKPSDYKLWRLHYHRQYNPEAAVRFVEQKIALYKDIKQNGFNYPAQGYIIRGYGPPWNYIRTGHDVVSILRHLHPEAVIEVAGYAKPPPRR